MSSKSFVLFCAQILLVKTAYGQVCGSLLKSGLSGNGLGLSNGLGVAGSNLGVTSGLGSSSLLNSNLGCSNLGLSNTNLGSNTYTIANLLANTSPSLLDQLSYGGSLSIASGSSLTPNGVSVSADNLVADGAVAVTGNMPLLGSVNVDGTVSSAGEGAVAYNTNSNVGLTSGGCGAGLGGSLNVNGFNGVGASNLAGLSGSNLAGLNSNLGVNGVNFGGRNSVLNGGSCGNVL